jgi:hypothetical protein
MQAARFFTTTNTPNDERIVPVTTLFQAAINKTHRHLRKKALQSKETNPASEPTTDKHEDYLNVE